MHEQRFGDHDYSRAWVLCWSARYLAGCSRVYPPRKALSVPPEWTALLLMDKAGVPRELIEHTFVIGPKYLEKRLRTATLLMIYPPYAARIERLGARMPKFREAQAIALPAPEEAACAQK